MINRMDIYVGGTVYYQPETKGSAVPARRKVIVREYVKKEGIVRVSDGPMNRNVRLRDLWPDEEYLEQRDREVASRAGVLDKIGTHTFVTDRDEVERVPESTPLRATVLELASSKPKDEPKPAPKPPVVAPPAADDSSDPELHPYREQGRVLKSWREAAGLSLVDFAKLTEMSPNSARQLEAGMKYPRGVVRERIAQAVGKTAADLDFYQGSKAAKLKREAEKAGTAKSQTPTAPAPVLDRMQAMLREMTAPLEREIAELTAKLDAERDAWITRSTALDAEIADRKQALEAAKTMLAAGRVKS